MAGNGQGVIQVAVLRSTLQEGLRQIGRAKIKVRGRNLPEGLQILIEGWGVCPHGVIVEMPDFIGCPVCARVGVATGTDGSTSSPTVGAGVGAVVGVTTGTDEGV